MLVFGGLVDLRANLERNSEYLVLVLRVLLATKETSEEIVAGICWILPFCLAIEPIMWNLKNQVEGELSYSSENSSLVHGAGSMKKLDAMKLR